MILVLTDHPRIDDEGEILSSNRIFSSLLDSAAIDRGNITILAAINVRPHMDRIESVLTRSKALRAKSLPPFRSGFFVPASLEARIKSVKRQIEKLSPDVIIALGPFSLWVLTGHYDISRRHGFIHAFGRIPVIPAYHPATIVRQYSFFLPTAGDFARANALATGLIRPEKFDYIAEPTLDDLSAFVRFVNENPQAPISIDIETRPTYRSIVSIGLGTSNKALCVQLWNRSRKGQSFWPSPQQEQQALEHVANVMASPNPKIMQNALYDLMILATGPNLRVHGPITDTRLQHLALYNEIPHNLAEIATGHLAMQPWKSDHKAPK